MQLNHSEKLNSFRQEIRKQQIDSFIANKRIKLLQHYQEQVINHSNMEV